MQLKGLDRLSEHLPELSSVGGRLCIFLYFASLFTLVTLYFITTDQILTWSIDSQIIVLALGFLVLSLFFSRKESYKARYGELAYRNAFAHYGIPGLMLLFAAIAHAGYMNGPFVPQGWWTVLFTVLGWYLLVSGVLLWIRAVLTFGFDNLTLLYVYYPEESKLLDSSIYKILRHPIYSAAQRLGIGLALLNGNANALAFALLMPLGFIGWIRLVEERELIERFGQSYVEYRKHVPAFWPRVQDIGKFFGFLIAGK